MVCVCVDMLLLFGCCLFCFAVVVGCWFGCLLCVVVVDCVCCVIAVVCGVACARFVLVTDCYGLWLVVSLVWFVRLCFLGLIACCLDWYLFMVDCV